MPFFLSASILTHTAVLTYVNIVTIIKLVRDINMTIRKKHPNKTVEFAIKYAQSKGWRYMKAGFSAHAWGRLLCPFNHREGCAMSA